MSLNLVIYLSVRDAAKYKYLWREGDPKENTMWDVHMVNSENKRSTSIREFELCERNVMQNWVDLFDPAWVYGKDTACWPFQVKTLP